MEVARSHNNEAIEKLVEYFNSKVKAVVFQEGELGLLNIHIVGKNRKLAEKKVNENGTVKIKN